MKSGLRREWLETSNRCGQSRWTARNASSPACWERSIWRISAATDECLLSRVNWGDELIALPPGASTEHDLTWLGISFLADLSSDGRQVLFTELLAGAAETGFMYLRQTDGAPAVRLSEGGARALSPDGKWVLCFAHSHQSASSSSRQARANERHCRDPS